MILFCLTSFSTCEHFILGKACDQGLLIYWNIAIVSPYGWRAKREA